ncbi:unnamed protein product [Spirodela intermedia]|uniref:Homeobox domain-containing protein n=1 Tax=Spirodela intermedia TaxID=51605 RepID=A0A7I8IDD5_SPIIN|nr:unnamed protein product [Spirodela intermedia]CAA6655052.1 unnamed protein product [Spirodela intermedia]
MEPVPAGPFTGYATILKGSRFLRPAQQMLEEVCGGGGAGGLAGDNGDEAEPLDFATESVGEVDRNLDGSISGEQRRMKTRLVSMLEEIQTLLSADTSGHHVLRSSCRPQHGCPYTPLAVRTLSKHFRCLKEAISSQLRFVNEPFGKDGQSKDEISGHKFMTGGFGYQRAASGSAQINQQPAWRPQRGLPERAVAVLRGWLFEHFLHPYPTDMDKQMLAKQTGLSRNQVSNWFINARVRLWKPMVEEIHSLELRRKVSDSDDNRNSSKQPDVSSSSFASPVNEQTHPSSSSLKNQEQLPHKRFQNELADIAGHVQEPVNFSLENLSSSHHRLDAPMAGVTAGGGHGGVSLTLGLHQNNGYCLSEQLPLNVVRRFGLEESNVAYVMGGFEGQERQFGKEFDGQLLRDFVA